MNNPGKKKFAFFSGSHSYENIYFDKEGIPWGFGWNEKGNLLQNHTNRCSNPVQIKYKKLTFLHFSFGWGHTLCIDDTFKAYSCGRNDYGQCGTGDYSANIGTLNHVLSNKTVGIDGVYCGYHHSIFRCKDGSIYGSGLCESGQLGIGLIRGEIRRPTLVKTNVMKNRIIDIACANRFTMFVDVSGVVYITESIIRVQAGYEHFLAISNTRKVYGGGSNDYFQISRERVEIKESVILLSGFKNNIKDVACGFYHSLILTTDGIAYGRGHNYYGEIPGKKLPKKVDDPVIIKRNVEQIHTGGYQTYVITRNGDVYGGGDNENSQLLTEGEMFPNTKEIGKEYIKFKQIKHLKIRSSEKADNLKRKLMQKVNSQIFVDINVCTFE